MHRFTSHCIFAFILLGALLSGCSGFQALAGEPTPTPDDCPVTEAVWEKPPDDAAVQDPPVEGFYYVNADRSMWAAAWWFAQEDLPLRASDKSVKVGWFRPEGAALAVTTRRLDAQDPAIDADIPCCYPTRFQPVGLFFPTAGCWEVSAKAADTALSYVVRVAP